MAEPSLQPVFTFNLIICPAFTGLAPMKGMSMSPTAERGDRVKRAELPRWCRRWRLATKPCDLNSVIRTLWQKERTDSYRLSFDLHTHRARVYTCIFNVNTCNVRVNLYILEPSLGPSTGLNTLHTDSVKA